jgi:hypothetical protein
MLSIPPPPPPLRVECRIRYVLQLLENVASVPNDVAATLFKGSKGGSEMVDSLLHIMDSASNDQLRCAAASSLIRFVRCG